ncbi:hypothetical protein OQA88_4710 [Cercophora sp. LCS_1]
MDPQFTHIALQWVPQMYANALPIATAEDPWIKTQVVQHAVADLQGCAIAVDASYYIHLQLEASPPEPLLTALGGLTGIQGRIETDLDNWAANDITPLFVFDGQPIIGQEEVTTTKIRQANEKTKYAWNLYFEGQADDAVTAFGQDSSSYRPQNLYPLLQQILKQRKLHFLVAPYNAAAQIAYFDMIDSDQVGGIMGSLELMLYPINDVVIRSINWETSSVDAVSKPNILKAMNVSELLFVDAFLMAGTSFLPPFPPLLDRTLTKNQTHSISDAVNILRTAEKNISVACTTFHDVLKMQDPNWLDKWRKARMAVKHPIYITEEGEVKVHDYDRLTHDNHEYLGLQLPPELFHYLNTGLIGPRILSWITHGQLLVAPTLDGVVSEEYKALVTNGSVRIKEAALSLVIPRLNRGIHHKDITMKVWYDRNFTYKVWDSHESKADFSQQVSGWRVADESVVASKFPRFAHGSILSEVTALQNPEFAALTLFAGSKDKIKEKPKTIESSGLIQSICLWRFLHIRGYVDDQHELTRWGKALAISLSSIEATAKDVPDAHLFEHVLVAYELLRLELLNARHRHEELRGLPINGSEEDKLSLLLISRCATLLKLRHEANGYTGPLNKNLLAFRSLASEVRSTDRDLIEALLASMFMYAQANRTRDDNWELSHGLPFLSDPDVAFGIAVKTYFDDIGADWTAEKKLERKKAFPDQYVPYATCFAEDLDVACSFFDSLYAGVKTLENEIPGADRQAWDRAAVYLAARK